MPSPSHAVRGFTLIELSIVIIIIGLVIGSITIGADLVDSAKSRATIAQYEELVSATNTFKLKYNQLPGDMDGTTASAFGFLSRTTAQGQGDGNTILEGNVFGASIAGFRVGAGETQMFFRDLSAAKLIKEDFSSAGPWGLATIKGVTYRYFPRAKIGDNHFFYVYSENNINSYGLCSWDHTVTNTGGCGATMPVKTAYYIDSKLDDGLPLSGKITPRLIADWSPNYWYASGNSSNNDACCAAGASSTTATARSSLTCYDNGNVNGATQKYSIGQNGGNGKNCALSFKF